MYDCLGLDSNNGISRIPRIRRAKVWLFENPARIEILHNTMFKAGQNLI
jgi:hypothetical protein